MRPTCARALVCSTPLSVPLHSLIVSPWGKYGAVKRPAGDDRSHHWTTQPCIESAINENLCAILARSRPTADARIALDRKRSPWCHPRPGHFGNDNEILTIIG
ncbi:hypothetical protein FIBSPDRAFT_446725 [Athelia psychrophila]|uniref:Uncharacterized protein n=1 Tax=Athelia psychrophila TaxID=1759441 RepID=A0A166MB32_9AGAM|nr:hypothetical protein FIBSPDRAFT_446725 [Fibularhizoctonia sp. CBS 109695]